MNEQAAPTLAESRPDGRGPRVVYLLGAGATQGCIAHLGSRHSLVMSGLTAPIFKELQRLADEKYRGHSGIRRLVNDVMLPESGLDIEQLITFLDDSPTLAYREFSSELREVFSSVLIGRLADVEQELGASRSRLYAALVDMYDVEGFNETLGGFLTLNYDVFLEHAIDYHLELHVDYGISRTEVGPGDATSLDRAIKVLKMHGSLGWSQEWPIKAELSDSPGIWIPPGLRKSKNDYPFNAIWGLARELLDCDILRIVGCNLGPNDWDLVSLLFSTRHTHATAPPYRIEVISEYQTVHRIRELFPYLEVLWLPDLPRVGKQIVGELLGAKPRRFAELPKNLQKEVISKARRSITNPFSYWLVQMGEAMTTDVPSLATTSGVFEQFIDTGR